MVGDNSAKFEETSKQLNECIHARNVSGVQNRPPELMAVSATRTSLDDEAGFRSSHQKTERHRTGGQ